MNLKYFAIKTFIYVHNKMNVVRLCSVLLTNTIGTMMVISPNLDNEMGSKEGDMVNEKTRFKNPFFVISFTNLIFNIGSFYHLYYYNEDSMSIIEYFYFSLILGGFVLRIWSYYTLGEHFTFTLGTRKSHQLVKTGPYKYLIHPSYTGVILIVAGSLCFFDVSSYLVAIVTAWVMWKLSVRMNLEEKILENCFAEEFSIYKKSRKRLIPYLY